MPEINFLESYYDNNDVQQIIDYTDECIDMYGFDCILRRWNNIQSSLDDLYQDLPSYKELDRTNNIFQNIHTRVIINYERFDQILQSYGLALQDNLALEGTMKLLDKPTEDDIIQILYPYDLKYHPFKISSADIHKGICYRVMLLPYYQDVKPEKVRAMNEPYRQGEDLKQIEINNLKDTESIKI